MNVSDYNYRFDDDPVDDVAKGCMGTMGMIVALVLTLLLCMCSCTTTKYVEVPGPTHTDTTYITKWQHDSIYQKDSVHVTERGESIMIDRWHTKYVALEKKDTMFHIIRDTVPKPYPVEVQVPAQLTWWQQARLHLANIVLWLVLIIALWWVVKSRLRVKG